MLQHQGSGKFIGALAADSSVAYMSPDRKALVVQGMVSREIANELRLSEHTVKNYQFRIFDNLGFSRHNILERR